MTERQAIAAAPRFDAFRFESISIRRGGGIVMAEATQAGEVLPRPRIPHVLGTLNIVFAAGLILFSLSLGGYLAVQPMTLRAMAQMQKKAEADRASKQQAE